MKKVYFQFLICFICLFSIFFSFKAHACLALQGKLIIIDAGHGYKDGGTSYNDILEKDINLKISKLLEQKLASYGASVLMVRNNDEDLSNGAKTHRKKHDFDNRIKIINNSNGDIYLSIHVNYLNDSSYFGSQVFYDKNNKRLADIIQKHLNKHLNINRKTLPIPKGTYMYKRLNIPGVLIECGFLSNSHDRNLLVNPIYQQKLVDIICTALIDFFY